MLKGNDFLIEVLEEWMENCVVRWKNGDLFWVCWPRWVRLNETKSSNEILMYSSSIRTFSIFLVSISTDLSCEIMFSHKNFIVQKNVWNQKCWSYKELTLESNISNKMSLIKTLNDIKGKFLLNLPTAINERFARERYNVRRKGIEYNFFSIPCAITNSFYTLVGLVLREISLVLLSTKFFIGGEEKRKKKKFSQQWKISSRKSKFFNQTNFLGCVRKIINTE